MQNCTMKSDGKIDLYSNRINRSQRLCVCFYSIATSARNVYAVYVCVCLWMGGCRYEAGHMSKMSVHRAI